MDTIEITYQPKSLLKGCDGTCLKADDDSKVRIKLNSKNPDWPHYIVAEVKNVEYDPLEYTFHVDESTLNPDAVEDFILPDSCDIISVKAYCCCDEIKDTLLVERINANTTRHYNFDGTYVDVVTGGGGSNSELIENADGSFDFVVDGVVTTTIPAPQPDTKINIIANANGTFTATDPESGESFTVGCLTIREDILEDQDTVTVAGFDPLTMELVEVTVDDAIVPFTGANSDGIGYINRRNGNVFRLTASANADYTAAFVVTYKFK